MKNKIINNYYFFRLFFHRDDKKKLNVNCTKVLLGKKLQKSSYFGEKSHVSPYFNIEFLLATRTRQDLFKIYFTI
jgi:hypothetical protein